MERLLKWLLMLTLSAAFLAVTTDAVRATSLIFGKTSTTSTEAPPEDPSASGDENVTDKSDNNSTKPTLTGIPQIDYILDPNLPRELNGYNLSNYPFLNAVPDLEDIDFKCDGLHDGFYASVKYDCQLYHHCLFGVRYDFLCANFTAFDQKTFICHFVSEVDCKNSAKYFHRNDALYEAATTTTHKPSTTTTTTTTTVAPPPAMGPPMRPGRPAGRPYRRPYRRRRPQVDYYYEDEEYDDDYYEERINRRRKQRPRPRRPEYDEYEDDGRYEPRQPYTERSRGKVEDDDYDYDRRVERPRYRPRQEDTRRPAYDDRRGYSDRRNPQEDRRNPQEDRRNLQEDRRNPQEDRRNPQEDRRNPQESRYRPQKDRRYPDEDRRMDHRKPINDRRPESVTGKQSRLREDDDRPIKRPIQEEPLKATDEPTKIRPSGSAGSNPLLFAPRTPPKIRRPVPINERQKYEYSSTTTTKAPEVQTTPLFDEYYDDEYEEEIQPESIPQQAPEKPTKPPTPPPTSPPTTRAPTPPSTPPPTPAPAPPELVEVRRPASVEKEEKSSYQRRPSDYEYYSDEYDERPKNTFKKPGVSLRPAAPPSLPPPRGTVRVPEVEIQAEDEEEEEEVKPKLTSDRFSSRVPGSGPPVFGTSRFRPRDEVPEQIETPYRSTQRPLQQYTMQTPIIGRGVPGPPVAPNVPALVDIPEEPQYQQFNRYRQEDLEEEAYRELQRGQEDANAREVIRPPVRVVKRPFLPSRGGNPVLPRGLQPVGPVNSKEVVTEGGPVDLGSTVSGVRMLEHSPPVLRYQQQQDYNNQQSPALPVSHTPQKFTYSGPRTTQSPQIPDAPKSTLEEIYNSDYDVTLNDALNPTLKPIAPSRGPTLGFSISAPSAKLLERSRYSLPYSGPGDVHYSSSQLRPAVQLPPSIRRHAPPYTSERRPLNLDYY
ncbi:uncharacterized protein DMENIID0001_168750 [Sergentomyia squamirostris]